MWEWEREKTGLSGAWSCCLTVGEGKAKELGAFRRGCEVKSAEDLLKLIRTYLTEGGSYAGMSALFRMAGEFSRNKIVVYKRIRNCGPWLAWLCQELYRREGLILERPKYLSGKHVCLIDGSKAATSGGTEEILFVALLHRLVHAGDERTTGTFDRDRGETDKL